MRRNEFDLVASIYDFLASVVFGDQLNDAQREYLGSILPDNDVLVLGGGTGKLIPYLPASRSIDFVEKSGGMLKRARNQSTNNTINFINDDFLTYTSDKQYNVIICPFFLDCFHAKTLESVLEKIKGMLIDGGFLIVIDFEYRFRNHIMMHLMHLFFKIVARLESNKLQDIHCFTLNAGFVVEKEKFFNQNMIFSRLYRNL